MNIDTQALIEETAVLFERIRNGSAGRGDLEAFASATADLHERAVILRYKAYEQQVYGNQPQVSEEQEVVSEEIATTEAAIESNDPDIDIPLPADPEPIAAEQEGFDLFSLNDEEEEPVFTPFSNDEPQEQNTAAENFSPEPDMPDFDEEDKNEIENPATIIEHPTVTAESENTASEIIEELVYATPEMKPELPADELKPKTVEETNGNHHPLYNRLHAGEDTLAARLLSVKLDTLNGAFGFNERMQIVDELFSGSNDAFNNSLHELDNLSSKNEARSLVTKLADQYNWNDRSDLVMEFVKKVERRYA